MMLHEWKTLKKNDNDMPEYDTVDLGSNVGWYSLLMVCRTVIFGGGVCMLGVRWEIKQEPRGARAKEDG